MAACAAEDADTVAILLNDDDLFGTFYDDLDEPFEDDITTALDVRGFDFNTWSLIPPPYLYAITKSATIVEKDNKKRKRGDIFLKLLKATKTA
jgi:hypothetical protein